MQRRDLIKQLVFAAGAVVLIPSCVQDSGKASILLKKLSISGSQEGLMAELAETIIPATTTPGAKEISAHLFALMMVDDCYTKADQDRFIEGLKAFQKKTDARFNKTFVKMTPTERETLLKELDGKKSGDANLDYFYNSTKKLVIQAYTTSKFYLTKVQVYKLIPGHYSGCVPVSKVS